MNGNYKCIILLILCVLCFSCNKEDAEPIYDGDYISLKIDLAQNTPIATTSDVRSSTILKTNSFDTDDSVFPIPQINKQSVIVNTDSASPVRSESPKTVAVFVFNSKGNIVSHQYIDHSSSIVKCRIKDIPRVSVITVVNGDVNLYNKLKTLNQNDIEKYQFKDKLSTLYVGEKKNIDLTNQTGTIPISCVHIGVEMSIILYINEKNEQILLTKLTLCNKSDCSSLSGNLTSLTNEQLKYNQDLVHTEKPGEPKDIRYNIYKFVPVIIGANVYNNKDKSTYLKLEVRELTNTGAWVTKKVNIYLNDKTTDYTVKKGTDYDVEITIYDLDEV